ncbi:hypothetical protein [Xanthobacter sediminis]|uniref:hypothetical protein n=1 Tax=Xanthobacter sediminis TaxID=3119926 RepID=UPI003728FFEA
MISAQALRRLVGVPGSAAADAGTPPAVAAPAATRALAGIARRLTGLAPLHEHLAPTTTDGAPLPLSRRHVGVVSFLVLVLLPTVASFLYLSLVALPQYRSEARFVVRGNLETVTAAGTPVSGRGAPQVPNTQEARVVVDYLRSRAMVEAVQQQFDLRRVFGASGRDPVFALSASAGMEDALAYWNRQVRVSLDTLSGVIKVQIQAFSPQSAAMVGAFVIKQAEAITNTLTTRNRGERVLRAEAEARAAFGELALVRAEQEQFRNAQGMIDPAAAARGAFAAIAKLRDQRSMLNTDLLAARADLAEDSPVVRALKERLRSLDEKITALDGELLGGASQAQEGTSGNLAANAALEARRRLAEQRLEGAERELADARAEQARKQVYILTFMAPNLPVEPIFPHPLTQAGAVFAVLAVIWGVAAFYVGSIYARTR